MNWRVLAIGIMVGMLASILLYAPVTESITNSYDPWADMNDDGVINILDVVKVASIYGTTGDPAKSVIVNGYYAKEWNETFQLNNGERKILWIPTKGLREITFKISIWPTVWEYVSSTTKIGYANATIYIRKQILNQTIDWERVFLDAKITVYSSGLVLIGGNEWITKEYDIGFSSMQIEVYARNPIECNVIFYITA
ncbi:hypothetical protein J7K27_05390 [Candidatus Bathyarchaeota archaeon]|nr:hypothetical protein [Candidatus Bathyarchaeota archaeon]